jgi:hypothetical protein
VNRGGTEPAQVAAAIAEYSGRLAQLESQLDELERMHPSSSPPTVVNAASTQSPPTKAMRDDDGYDSDEEAAHLSALANIESERERVTEAWNRALLQRSVAVSYQELVRPTTRRDVGASLPHSPTGHKYPHLMQLLAAYVHSTSVPQFEPPELDEYEALFDVSPREASRLVFACAEDGPRTLARLLMRQPSSEFVALALSSLPLSDSALLLLWLAYLTDRDSYICPSRLHLMPHDIGACACKALMDASDAATDLHVSLLHALLALVVLCPSHATFPTSLFSHVESIVAHMRSSYSVPLEVISAALASMSLVHTGPLSSLSSSLPRARLLALCILQRPALLSSSTEVGLRPQPETLQFLASEAPLSHPAIEVLFLTPQRNTVGSPVPYSLQLLRTVWRSCVAPALRAPEDVDTVRRGLRFLECLHQRDHLILSPWGEELRAYLTFFVVAEKYGLDSHLARACFAPSVTSIPEALPADVTMVGTHVDQTALSSHSQQSSRQAYFDALAECECDSMFKTEAFTCAQLVGAHWPAFALQAKLDASIRQRHWHIAAELIESMTIGLDSPEARLLHEAFAASYATIMARLQVDPELRRRIGFDIHVDPAVKAWLGREMERPPRYAETARSSPAVDQQQTVLWKDIDFLLSVLSKRMSGDAAHDCEMLRILVRFFLHDVQR